MTTTPTLTQGLPIAILGAGPIGLEAALAAADKKIPFVIFEAGAEVAKNVKDWGHVDLFTPWSLSVSPRMRRHLAAVGLEPPDGDAYPSGEDLRQQALIPAAQLPVIAPCLKLSTRVVSVGRQGLLKQQAIGSQDRAQRPFRLLTVDSTGRECVTLAGAVIDCTGTWSNPNWVGDGGIPAPGERTLSDRIVHRIPDLEAEMEFWAGQRILLVGAGHSAQTAARDLAQFAATHPGTRVSWTLRSDDPRFAGVENDPLPVREALAAYARGLVAGTSSAISVIPGVSVDSFAERDGQIEVQLRRTGGDLEPMVVDLVLALTGASGDFEISRQLQVHQCYATEGPMKLAATLLGDSSGDCLTQTSQGIDSLRSPEPNFFILGIKSYGRNNTFLLRVGWDQVDEVMAQLGPDSGDSPA